jgi:asparagine synthase (glutamine-hydrolysing)
MLLMCGIAGLLDATAGRNVSLAGTIAAMTGALDHRGPDDSGVWSDEASGLALGFRRLAIIDLSMAGHQPMVSASGRYVIVYNGEIYNANDLRPELEARGVKFRGHSDTEVMLEAFDAFGVPATLDRLIGMFALALWDREKRVLTLARDRLGIKPLYWARFGGLFLFGSEMKALYAHPGWPREIDRDAVTSYLRFGYVPGPISILKGVQKLAPGTILTMKAGSEPAIEPFWSARDIVGAAVGDRFAASPIEAAERLETLLKDAVSRRMVADVPLGAFLSGGIDSSLVVALMQASTSRPVRTFTIGFNEQGYDEAAHAKGVAAHLGTDHTELYVTPEHAQSIIPRLPEIYDEPFADSSQIPTFLISEMTRRHVTVALSGDGGDELFAGYPRYAFAQNVWSRLQWAPPALRRVMAGGIGAVSPACWDKLAGPLAGSLLPRLLGDKMHKAAGVLRADDPDAFYRRVVSQWPEPETLVAGGKEPEGPLGDPTIRDTIPGYVERMQFLDLVTYLPDDILVKVDRASMAMGLEVRVPLIDHRVVDFAFRLPLRLKLRGGTSKWLLRQILYRYVPKALVERPKMGFGVPIDSWLRGPLRDWAESLLDRGRLARGGLIDPEPVRRAWEEHLSGRRNWQYRLWTVLMLEAWRERWMA